MTTVVTEANEKDLSESDRGDKDEPDDSEDPMDGDDVSKSEKDHIGPIGRKSVGGQMCTLKTLIEDKVLQPGDSILHVEYLGRKFTADLLTTGTIRQSDTQQVFATPSAWLNNCKRTVNPENTTKASSAWSTIRYKGKRLDTYKLKWYRRHKKVLTNSNVLDINPKDILVNSESQGNRLSTEDPEVLRRQNVVEHATLPLRTQVTDDMKMMVRCVPFAAIDRIQPFNMNFSTNALLLIDFHSHLTWGEVTGYLGGTWDYATHTLSILQAFPCRARLGDKDRAEDIEEEIKQNMEQRSLALVGWYHSHPRCPPHPTLKDVELQLEYQIALKGESEAMYTPCIGLICSPFDISNSCPESSYQAFWVMPPPEFCPQQFGRPMKLLFGVTRDSFLTQDLLLEMRLLAHFYMDGPDAVKFDKECHTETNITFWQKLQSSLTPNLPRDLQSSEGQSLAQVQVQQEALSHFWAFLKGLLIPDRQT